MKILAVAVLLTGAVAAQDLPNAPSHKFLDTTNKILITTTVASVGVDAYLTDRTLSNGGVEVNPFSKPFMGSRPVRIAYWSVSATSQIGIAYLLHRYNHHKIERVVLFVKLADEAQAITYCATH